MRITVFTPTYNRAYIIKNLFESLKEQTFKDFEWLVVDDGSEDGTTELFNVWSNEHAFIVRYYSQENGGKHRAVNRGLQLAQGELFFIVDSDDQLPPNSLELVEKYYRQIEGDQSFAGVCGLKAFYNGSTVNNNLPFEILDSNHLELTDKYKIHGDMAQVVRTAVFKKFPFPDFKGEKYCGESLIWDRIACHYKFRYFSEVIYLCEYLLDGLSQSFVKNKRMSPTYATLIYLELMNMDVTLYTRIRSAINFWRYFFCLKTRTKTNNHLPFWAWLFSPIGIIIYYYDTFRLRKLNG